MGKWFLKHWMWIVGAVLAVSAGVGVIVGVMLHSEPGLDPELPRWEAHEIPLALCVHSYGSDHTTQTHIERAQYVVGVINERLGFVVYEMSGDADCDVVLTFGMPSETTPMEGRVVEPGGGAYVRGDVCYAETVNVHGEVEQLVVQHELLHCLGLGHDDFETSIMRPVQSETPMRTLPPWISDDDRALLRELYAPL